jgi:osmoprotectant transport system ATP-binding protein
VTAVTRTGGSAGAAPPGTVDDAVAIHLQDVRKEFPGAVTPAVADLDLEVVRGEIAVLIGPSGCGKTTTLRMINRLVEATSGRITVEGRDVRDVPAHELRRGIGYVIQQVGLLPHRSVADNIATVPRLLGWDRRRTRARVAELAELVGLDAELLRRWPAELSGGQQQRVGVARALAADPPVLLMDEPFGAVDPVVRGRLQDELLALQQTLRKTIVLVTHDVDEAVKLGDRVAVLDVGGVLEQYAPPDELLAAPANPFVASFLGTGRSLRRLAVNRVGDLPRHDGAVVDASTGVEAARATAATVGSDWVGATAAGRFAGWCHVDGLPLDGTVGDADLVPAGAMVSPSSSLADALEVILSSSTPVAVVVGDDGAFGGVVTLERIRAGLDRAAGGS